MSSRCRNSLLALALVAGLCACQREERGTQTKPLAQAIPSADPDTIFSKVTRGIQALAPLH